MHSTDVPPQHEASAFVAAQRVTVIAEAGVNHNGDVGRALELVDAAANAGADVIKFQTFDAAAVVGRTAPKAAYQLARTSRDESQLEMIRRLELPRAAYDSILERCEQRGVQFLSTPFDLSSARWLASKGLRTGKVASGEMTNRPLLEEIADLFESLIVSTGMCSLEEVAAALHVVLSRGSRLEHITLLHCTTAYPTPFDEVNLAAMDTLRQAFGTRVGLSDHSTGIEVAIAAAARGAEVIEKHVTIDKNLPGPDHAASLEPDELASMIRAIRNVSAAIGTGTKSPTASERANMMAARRSIHLIADVSAGQLLRADDLAMLRPGNGLSPMAVGEVVGRVATRQLRAGDQLRADDVR